MMVGDAATLTFYSFLNFLFLGEGGGRGMKGGGRRPLLVLKRATKEFNSCES